MKKIKSKNFVHDMTPLRLKEILLYNMHMSNIKFYI